MNWNDSIIKRRRQQNIKMLPRIKIGRVLFLIANLPLMTAWLYPIAIPMMMPLGIGTRIKGKLNRLRGNGDLELL